MKIDEILQAITDFILHFDLKKYEGPLKIILLAIVAIVMAIFIFGATFARVPQF